MTDKLAYTISETVAACGIGRTTIYEMIKTGAIRPAKIGTRTLILRRDLESLLDQLQRQRQRRAA